MFQSLKKVVNVFKNEHAQNIGLALLIAGFTYLALSAFSSPAKPVGNPAKAAVMITNQEMNSGGTGIILKSTQDHSLVLTNNIVRLKLVSNGLIPNETWVECFK